ncbi:MAG: NIPSNAP family protein [Thermaceae bacterium]|nr:NIPSNAP family protein [Thermaceae bacterium]
MKTQLRIYTINKGQLEQFALEWSQKLKPLREKIGFRVLGAWTVADTNQFVWIMALDDAQHWERLDAAYFASQERKTMQPDPGRLIARMENHFVDVV